MTAAPTLDPLIPWLAELEVKARGTSSPPEPPRFGGGWGGWWNGMAPGARFDYGVAAGDFNANGVVAVCRRWIRINAAAGPRLCVGTCDPDTGEYDPDADHPLVASLKRPNPFMSWAEVIGNLAWELAYPGYTYLLKARPRLNRSDAPREFYFASHREVAVEWAKPGDRRPVRGYWYSGAGRDRQWYEPEDVVHFRNGSDPLNPWQGHSELAAQVRNVYALNCGEGATAAAIRNGHKATLISPKEGMGGPWDENTSNTIKRVLRSDSSGESYGGIAGNPTPFDVHTIGFSPEEAMLDRILDRPSAMVVAALGLNELILGLPGSATTRTYSNLEEAYKQAFETGLLPLLAIIADGLQQSCLGFNVDAAGNPIPPDFGDGSDEAWFDVSEIPALQEAADSRSVRAIQEWINDGLTWDEFRDALGRKPVGPARGGDLFYSELGMRRAEAVAGMTQGEGGGVDAGLNADSGSASDNDSGSPRVVDDDESAETYVESEAANAA